MNRYQADMPAEALRAAIFGDELTARVVSNCLENRQVMRVIGMRFTHSRRVPLFRLLAVLERRCRKGKLLLSDMDRLLDVTGY